jgi:hypothetical protein
MTLERATPSVCLKAWKKLYIALTKGRLSLKVEACVAKPYTLKSMPRLVLAIRERKIHEGILVD